MKKHLLGLFAIVLAIMLNSFTTSKQLPGEEPLNWYPTDVDGVVQTTTPIIFDEVKSVVMSTVSCNDLSDDFCYYGTAAESLPSEFDASQEPSEQIILKTP